MPELPEVETICRSLEPILVGQEITEVLVNNRQMRVPVPDDFEMRILGQTVTKIWRRGKYMLWNISSEDTVILHFGMSGRMEVCDATQDVLKHDHILFGFGNDGREVRLNDPRRFGLAVIEKTSKLAEHKLLAHMGPEPFADEFTGEYLFKKLQKKKTPIRTALMDGRIVVGMGNIYVNEVLFRLGIHPARPANKITKAEAKKLVKAIIEILYEAIAVGGSTLKDFTTPSGELGYFFEKFAVYGREGKPCDKCGSAIVRETIGQRGTWYCSSCQE